MLLRELAVTPSDWRYGYELGQEVGLKAGTLYPILMRLSDQGLLEASWEQDPPMGRPRRHMYRILPPGLRVAMEHAPRATEPNVERVNRRSPQPRGAW